jgi:hypothetical protein
LNDRRHAIEGISNQGKIQVAWELCVAMGSL